LGVRGPGFESQFSPFFAFSETINVMIVSLIMLGKQVRRPDGMRYRIFNDFGEEWDAALGRAGVLNRDSPVNLNGDAWTICQNIAGRKSLSSSSPKRSSERRDLLLLSCGIYLVSLYHSIFRSDRRISMNHP
jgi:hypothetical protein